MKKIKNFWTKLNPEPRPYWFVDAKWVFGILFFIFLTLTLWFYSYSQLLAQDNVINIISNQYEGYLRSKVQSWNFDNGGIAKLKYEIDAIRQQLRDAAEKAKNNEGVSDQIDTSNIEIIPGFDINSERDLINKYTREAEATVYNKIAEILDKTELDEVLESVAKIEEEIPAELNLKNTIITGIKQNIIQSINFPEVYSPQAHQNAKQGFWLFLILSAVTLLGVIFFSCGFGRIFVPGLVILLSAGPGYYFFSSVYRYLEITPLNNLLNSRIEFVSKLTSIIIKAKNQQLEVLTRGHMVPFIIGCVLFVGGITLYIIFSIRRKREKR